MHELLEKLKRNFGGLPFSAEVVKGELKDFVAANAKVAALVKAGYLIRIKKGLFCLSPQLSGEAANSYAVANCLYGPSYVSFETVLASEGLIEDKAVEVMSAVNRRGKAYNTPIGRFSYATVPAMWFPIGVQSRQMNGTRVLVASREKALADVLLLRENLRIVSPKGLRSYLEDDLRLDVDGFANPDVEVFRELAECGCKVQLMNALERMFT